MKTEMRAKLFLTASFVILSCLATEPGLAQAPVTAGRPMAGSPVAGAPSAGAPVAGTTGTVPNTIVPVSPSSASNAAANTPVAGSPVAASPVPGTSAAATSAAPTQLNINGVTPAVTGTPNAAMPADGQPTTAKTPGAAANTNTNIANDPVITNVIDRLKQNTAPLSLGDMAAAQDTLARLNLLGDIEQKLSQIETARTQREGVSAGAGMGASALPNLPLPPAASNMPPLAMTAMPDMSAFADTGSTVDHISGTNGNYNAAIKIDGRPMIVRRGTVLPSGARVTDVSATGVKIKSKAGHNETLSFSEIAAPTTGNP